MGLNHDGNLWVPISNTPISTGGILYGVANTDWVMVFDPDTEQLREMTDEEEQECYATSSSVQEEFGIYGYDTDADIDSGWGYTDNDD